MEDYFCVRHKIRRKHNQHFKLTAIFQIKFTLWYIIHVVFSSLKMQRRLIQTKVHFKCFESVRIETSHKPSKTEAAKLFSLVNML